MHDIAENLFKAVSTIAEKRIANLEFDKTIICTITNTDNEKNNKYTVSDGSVEFEANGDGQTYRVNDSVRVLILNGDYTKEKFIQGKYSANENAKPITYISPLESVLNLTDNICNNSKIGTKGLKANGTQKEITLATFDFDENQICNKDIFNTMFLSAEFYSALDQYDVRSGDYGLHLLFVLKDSQGNADRRDLYFSAKRDMIGNPYAFKIFTQQEITYELSAWPDNIVGAKLYFYQDNDFKYYDKASQQIKNIDVSPINNLQVKNIKMGFGSKIALVQDDQLTLYTNNSLTYDHLADASSIANNEKTMELIWYNKTEDNEYVGFSDGIFDITYDEKNYENTVANNIRLLEQIDTNYPDDELCLDLKADIAELKTSSLAAAKIIGNELYSLLRGLKQHIDALNISELNNLINVVGNYQLNLETNTANLEKIYNNILINIKKGEKTENISKDEINNLEKDIINPITQVNTNIETILKDFENKINNGYGSYKSIYDNYRIKLNNISARLNTLSSEIDNICNTKPQGLPAEDKYAAYDNAQTLYDLSQQEITLGPSYTDKKNTGYDNRYAIYWFVAEPGYTEVDYPYLPQGWKYIKGSRNKGLPSEQDANNLGYYPKKPTADDANRVLMYKMFEEGQTPKATQTIKAVLFYNHEKFVSSELIFTNNSEIKDSSAANINGALIIEHDSNSYSSYQSYGSNGYLLNAGDSYKKRSLKASFNGVNGEKEDSLIGATIYWYIPNHSTMLNIHNNELDETWYTNRLDSYKSLEALTAATEKTAFTNRYYQIEDKIYGWDSENKVWSENVNLTSDALREASLDKAGYDCYYKQIENITTDFVFPYHIKDYYLSTATQNGIYCKIIKGDNIYYGEIFFTFSSYGTSGTNYTLTLIPDANYPMYINNFSETNEPLPLNIDITLYDSTNTPVNINNCNLATTFEEQYRVVQEFADGKTVGCFIEAGDNFNINNNNQPLGDILTCIVSDVFIDELNQGINLETKIAIPYSAIDSYYIEGASMVLYDSFGSNPSYYKSPYKLYNKLDNTPISDVNWSIEHYKTDGTKIILTPEQETEGFNTEFAKSNLLSLDKDNNLKVPNMYIDQDVYSIVYAKVENAVLWAQPIIVLQNRYSSSMLNHWDGKSLKIDNDNSTILSTMLGAGRKNEQNQFEGVLMGDVTTGSGDDAITTVGLYGFHDGAQSFGFKVDGTAFLGKNSGGRIYMDGNNAFLYSQSWLGDRSLSEAFIDGEPQSGTAGMLIDLKNGYIDAYNFKLTSGLFTLSNEHLSPSTESDLRAWYGDDGTDDSPNSKGNIIFKAGNETNNDIFAITSGGHFYAQAGKVANWNVGNNYLITDQELGTENSFHMYSDGKGNGTIAEQTLSNWMLGIGSNFGVDVYGNLYAKGGKIGPLGIHTASIGVGTGTAVGATASSTYIGEGSIETGKCQIAGLRIGNYSGFYGASNGPSSLMGHLMHWHYKNNGEGINSFIALTSQALSLYRGTQENETRQITVSWEELIQSGKSGQMGYSSSTAVTGDVLGEDPIKSTCIALGNDWYLEIGIIKINNAISDGKIIVTTGLTGIAMVNLTPMAPTKVTGDDKPDAILPLAIQDGFSGESKQFSIVWCQTVDRLRVPTGCYYMALGFGASKVIWT